MNEFDPLQIFTGQVTAEVERLLRALAGKMSRQQIQDVLILKHRDHFKKTYLKPALAAKAIEPTLPDKPRSRLQRYRLTSAGRRWLETHPA